MTPTGRDRVWRLIIKTNFELELDVEYTLHDSLYWAQPLNIERTKYFHTHKTVALPLEGTFTFAGNS